MVVTTESKVTINGKLDFNGNFHRILDPIGYGVLLPW